MLAWITTLESPEFLDTYHISQCCALVVVGHDSTSAQHMSRTVSFDCRTARYKHHLCHNPG